MNGSKAEKCGISGLCCVSGFKLVYIGIVMFVVGIMLQNNLSTPQIVEILGAMIVITGSITMFFREEKLS